MSRGSLRVYLGAAPGVGKTYAMLGEAHRRRGRGTDVVVGFADSHSRVHTEAMLAGLEKVPGKFMGYSGAMLSELDVDAVLARNPTVALVDELAHSNVPGSFHHKRWQDVDQLLDAGIDVVTTVNVEHLESLNAVVESITGIKPTETVPDSVVRSADQIELVDMSPEALRRRLAHGHVYPPDKVDAALGNYFREGNLGALRELALLWLADRVDERLEKYRHDHQINQTWAARQCVVVALTGGPEGDTVLRRASVVAGRSAGRGLVAVHVVQSDGAHGAQADALVGQRRLAQDLGGQFHTVVGDDVATAVLEFARSVNGTRIVVGQSRRGRVSTALRPSAAAMIVRDSGEIDVQVVTHERASGPLLSPAHRRGLTARRRVLGLVAAILLPTLATIILLPLEKDGSVEISIVLVAMLAAVVGCSLIGGMTSAVTASLWATALTNYWFIPPENTFLISQPENVVALAMFILVGCTIAAIVDRSAALAREAAQRRAEADALNALSANVLHRHEFLVRGLLELACSTFGMRAAVLFEQHAQDDLVVVVDSVGVDPPPSPDAADVCIDTEIGLRLAVSGRTLSNSERRILVAYGAQAGALLERDRLAASAAEATNLRESDNARRLLLATVSHDLRTPIAGIKAAISTLADEQLDLTEVDRRTLLAAAGQGTDRLSSLVTNLLDMNRLQTGSLVVQLRPAVLDEVIQNALAGVADSDVISDISDELSLVRTDPVLLERVLANLIENAARQEAGGVAVRVEAGEISMPVPHLDVRVIDRGPGVPQQERAAMFAPFRRLGDRKQTSDGGVGLGLAVAAGLAELIGCTIEVDDTPGGGLTMVVSIPVDVDAQQV